MISAILKSKQETTINTIQTHLLGNRDQFVVHVQNSFVGADGDTENQLFGLELHMKFLHEALVEWMNLDLSAVHLRLTILTREPCQMVSTYSRVSNSNRDLTTHAGEPISVESLHLTETIQIVIDQVLRDALIEISATVHVSQQIVMLQFPWAKK
jgi:hypothetical protein